MEPISRKPSRGRISRRQFLALAAAGGAAAATGVSLVVSRRPVYRAEIFILKALAYEQELTSPLRRGLAELGVTAAQIQGKRILLKPNLVEPHRGAAHVNTHPLVVRAAVEAFLGLGAAAVMVAEGSGHRRDTHLILEESGFADVLAEDRIRFFDLNRSDVFVMENRGKQTGLSHLVLPRELLLADIIVSMAKMKTHHWVGATLSMKNLFGVMPGGYYGWPKNVLHKAGIPGCILDINATVRPQLAIVDGIVGMEGDGPIMGEPVAAGVLVLGRSLPAVDATCARIMGIDPLKMPYLKRAGELLGPIDAREIAQRGERIDAVRRDFRLLDQIPAQQGLRLVRI
ncbi:MAG: DUF362 domain-containing protein [Desulfobacterales bacterium]|nr:DUF362 domain-containing protein [Desulfobacterales bacterium]